MRVRLLGTAAGGGFPQWNCDCRNCRGVRDGTLRAAPRNQSSVAVSSDGRRWFLLNASPDVRFQVESFAPLLPPDDREGHPDRPGRRGTGIAGVLLTNADLDHTLGLLILREGGRLAVHAPAPVHRSLVENLGLASVLGHYCGIEWREPPSELSDLRDADGAPAGLRYQAFPVPGKPPRYAGGWPPSPGDAVGYRVVDPVTGGSVVCAPDVAALDPPALRHLADCDLLLFDGTFWSDDEMTRAGVGSATAAEMGHLPVGGPEGSMARLRELRVGRTVYVHMNNTNPMLVEDSPERGAVTAAGFRVGADGMEFTV